MHKLTDRYIHRIVNMLTLITTVFLNGKIISWLTKWLLPYYIWWVIIILVKYRLIRKWCTKCLSWLAIITQGSCHVGICHLGSCHLGSCVPSRDPSPLYCFQGCPFSFHFISFLSILSITLFPLFCPLPSFPLFVWFLLSLCLPFPIFPPLCHPGLYWWWLLYSISGIL